MCVGGHGTLKATFFIANISVIDVLNRKSEGRESCIQRGLKFLIAFFSLDITEREGMSF